MTAIELLRDVGQHFRVNQMLAKEAVSARLESETGISYTEFSYQILQAMDFLELYRRYGCTLQTGGSDQWGNLTAGLDLLRRVEGRTAHALATPLVAKADGTKFGKTESGTVWLDPELTSPYAFFQFWVNADDRDVSAYLRLFSLRGRPEIEDLEARSSAEPAARAAQRELADELTTLVHGAAQARAVQEASRALFGQGALDALDEATLSAALQETPNAAGAGRRHDHRPARRDRPDLEPRGGPAGRRRGRRLRQQRAGHRRRRGSRPDRVPARSLAGAQARETSPGRGREAPRRRVT